MTPSDPETPAGPAAEPVFARRVAGAGRRRVAERRAERFGPAGPPARPYVMHLTFGRPAGNPRTSIDLHGDTLVAGFADGQTARSVPSDADWRTFSASIDVARWGRFSDRWDGVDELIWTAEIRAPSLDVTGGSRDE